MDFAKENNIPLILIQHTNPGEDAVKFKKGTDGHKIHEDVVKKDYDRIIEKKFAWGLQTINNMNFK